MGRAIVFASVGLAFIAAVVWAALQQQGVTLELRLPTPSSAPANGGNVRAPSQEAADTPAVTETAGPRPTETPVPTVPVSRPDQASGIFRSVPLIYIDLPFGSGRGSGVVIAHGYVATAYHVIRVAPSLASILVVDWLGEPYRVEDRWSWPHLDLAILRVPSLPMPRARLNTLSPVPGTPICAAGRPGQRFEPVLSCGRFVDERGYTDLRLREGMSGGPCYDSDLRVYGLVSQGVAGEPLSACALFAGIVQSVLHPDRLGPNRRVAAPTSTPPEPSPSSVARRAVIFYEFEVKSILDRHESIQDAYFEWYLRLWKYREDGYYLEGWWDHFCGQFWVRPEADQLLGQAEKIRPPEARLMFHASLKSTIEKLIEADAAKAAYCSGQDDGGGDYLGNDGLYTAWTDAIDWWFRESQLMERLSPFQP